MKRATLNEIEKRMPSILQKILKIPEVARYQSFDTFKIHLWEIRVMLDRMIEAVDNKENQQELEV